MCIYRHGRSVLEKDEVEVFRLILNEKKIPSGSGDNTNACLTLK